MLADKSMVEGHVSGRKHLLDCFNGLPCILMADSPSPDDVMKVGALHPVVVAELWKGASRHGWLASACPVAVKELDCTIMLCIPTDVWFTFTPALASYLCTHSC